MNLLKKCFLVFVLFSLILSACKKSIGPENDPENLAPEPPLGTEETLLAFSPNFPSENEPISFVFDASKGDGGLKNFTGDVYIFTGVITENSQQPGDWRYGKWDWNEVPPSQTKLKAMGNGKYGLEISDVHAFYNIPKSEKVLKLAMLFRNADGSKVARNQDGSDIFMPLYDPSQLHVRLISPHLEPTFIPSLVDFPKMIGEEIEVKAISSKQADLTLLLNGNNFQSQSKATSISGTVKVTSNGNQLIEVKASATGVETNASIEFTITGEVEQAEIPSTARIDGFTRLNNGTSVIMTLYAPLKKGVFVIGDFNDWKANSAYFMKRSPDGKRWWLQIDGLDPQREYGYQFLVDGSLKIADPYAEKILDPSHDEYIPVGNYNGMMNYPRGKTSGIVSVFQGQPPSYAWEVSSFKRPDKNELIIYELHLRDFISSNNFNTLKDTLSYLKNLGINALQLMPVNEFEGNSSWGYNPSFYFSPDKFYGSPVMLKKLIDQCHQAGMAVILDMVLNHSFGQSPMVQLYFDPLTNQPSAESPWFNSQPTHPFNVGYDFNHEQEATQLFTQNVLSFWMKEFRIDGFRFDLSKGFTQRNSGEDVASWSRYDASRIALWKKYNQMMQQIDPHNFYVILEHFADDQEEQELAQNGMMLWNNLNGSFNEASMGYLPGSDFSRGFYDTHGFQGSAQLISYMESHDEERMMYKNLQYGNAAGTYSIKSLKTALKRQEMAAAFFFAIPGPKMVWQFGELGYDISIEENGRTGEKPVLWNYKEHVDRMNLYRTYAKLITLKKKKDVFNTSNVAYNLKGAIKYILLQHANETLFVIGNFDVIPHHAVLSLPKSGIWYNQFTNDQLSISSNTYEKELAPGEYYVYSDQVY